MQVVILHVLLSDRVFSCLLLLVHRRSVGHWWVSLEVALVNRWGEADWRFADDSLLSWFRVPLFHCHKVIHFSLFPAMVPWTRHCRGECRNMMKGKFVVNILPREVFLCLENSLSIQSIFVFHQVIWIYFLSVELTSKALYFRCSHSFLCDKSILLFTSWIASACLFRYLLLKQHHFMILYWYFSL